MSCPSCSRVCDAQFDDSAYDTSQASHPTHIKLHHDVIFTMEMMREGRRGPAGSKFSVPFSASKSLVLRAEWVSDKVFGAEGKLV